MCIPHVYRRNTLKGKPRKQSKQRKEVMHMGPKQTWRTGERVKERVREVGKKARRMDNQPPPLQLGLMYLQRIASGCCS